MVLPQSSLNVFRVDLLNDCFCFLPIPIDGKRVEKSFKRIDKLFRDEFTPGETDVNDLEGEKGQSSTRPGFPRMLPPHPVTLTQRVKGGTTRVNCGVRTPTGRSSTRKVQRFILICIKPEIKHVQIVVGLVNELLKLPRTIGYK